jgi:uncharacterized protein YkwD
LWRPVLTAVLLLLTVPATVLAWDAKAFSSADESRLVSLVNQRRAAAGLGALTADSTLTSVARSRSKKMGDSHTFSHTIGGSSAFDDLRAAGYCFYESAENITWNSYPDDQATAVAWQTLVSSSSHLANILGAAYTRIGVGAYKAADGTKVYVMLLVRACGTSAPKSPATASPMRRTATPTRPPTAKPALPAAQTPAPTIAPAPVVAVVPVETGPPDPLRPRPAHPGSASATSGLEAILELLWSLLRALIGAPG